MQAYMHLTKPRYPSVSEMGFFAVMLYKSKFYADFAISLSFCQHEHTDSITCAPFTNDAKLFPFSHDGKAIDAVDALTSL